MDILSLPLNIIIGNIISFFASIALILSCIVNDKREAYKYQVIEALILTVSSVFFLSWTGILTMLIAAARNYLVHYYNPYHLPNNQYNGLDRTSTYDWDHTVNHLQLLFKDNKMDKTCIYCKCFDLCSLLYRNL